MNSDHQVLQELNEGYIRSVRTSDVQWFEKHLAPDGLTASVS